MLSRKEFLRYAAVFGVSLSGMDKLLAHIAPGHSADTEPFFDFSFWYLRQDDLIDLEFGFRNLKQQDGAYSKRRTAEPAYMIVRLPQMHLSEQMYPENQPMDENTLSRAYLAGYSYLVFKFREARIKNFELTPECFFSWNSDAYFDLVLVKLDDAQQMQVGYDLQAVIPGLAFDPKQQPVTSFEIPYGLTMAPFAVDNEKVKFKRAGEPFRQRKYDFPNINEGDDGKEHVVYTAYANALGKGVLNSSADKDKYHPYTELWYNDLEGEKSKAVNLKVVGFNANSSDDDELLPSQYHKKLLYGQFVPAKAKEEERSEDALDKTILAKQVVTAREGQFRITPHGLVGTLEYVSPDARALLQKLLQEIRLGRDQYVEVQTLGYMYPLGLRVVEIEIGQRKIMNGICFVQRKKYIAPLDKVLDFRTDDEQGDAASPESVLSRDVDDRPDMPAANYMNSCKRSFPFRRIEVLTKEYIQIEDTEADIKTAVKDDLTQIRTQYKDTAGALIDKLTGFIAELNKQNYKLKKDVAMQVALGDALVELAGKYDEQDFLNLEYAVLTNVLTDLDVRCQQFLTVLQTRADAGFADLQNKVQAVLAEKKKVAQQTIDQLQSEVGRVAKKAMEAMNKVQDAQNKVQNNIASIATDGRKIINAYWPKEKNAGDLKFSFKGIDWDGNEVKFDAGFIFTSGESARKVDLITQKKQELEAKIEAAIDKQVVYLKGYYLDWSKRIDNYLSKPAAEIQTLNDRLKEEEDILLHEAYNVADDLMSRFDIIKNAADQQKAAVILRIIALRDKEVDAFNAEKTQIETEINTWEAELKNKARHLIYANVFLFQTEQIMSGHFDSVKAKLRAQLESIKGTVNSWVALPEKQLEEDWYRLNNQMNQLDRDIVKNYHDVSNAARRQINLANTKIAYYKSELQQDAENKVNELETQYFELAAIPMARLADMRHQYNQLTADADRRLQRLKNFGRQYALTFPQLLTAMVKLPVVNEIMKGEARLISYADAYRQAGIEQWKETTKDAEKLKRNAERILFEVKQPVDKLKDQAKAAMNSATDAYTKLKNQVLAAGNAYQKDAVAVWQSLNKDKQDFETATIGYARGKADNIFAAAKAKVGGLVDPGVVIETVSAIKGMTYKVSNQVNKYTGAINRYSDGATQFFNQANKTFNDYQNNVKDFVISQRDKINDTLKDIKLFGLSMQKMINDKLDFLPNDFPEAKIELIKNGPLPIGARVNYAWSTRPDRPIFKDEGSGVKFYASVDKINTGLELTLKDEMYFAGEQKNDLTTTIGMTNFGIGAADIIKINFERIAFTKKVISVKNGNDWSTTSSSDLQIQIRNVEFSGFLELVKQLQDKLGLGDGFLIQLSSDAITLSYGVRFPTISTGAFIMSNINLYAGLVLSFKNESPALRFSFGERTNPFTMAVSIYGGRGFFGITVNKDGVKVIEASLEFGAYLALDIAGIAKGQAYLMAGIYFRQTKGQGVYVESYVVCGGNLSIIGLIQVSLVFYLGMSYQSGALRGRASVEVSVKVLFFSASYNLTFEKQITGGSGLTGGGFFDLFREKDELAYSSPAHGPSAADDSDDWYAPGDPQPYCYLIDDYQSEKAKYIPVYDPTLLYEHSMDFNKYVQQFGI